MSASASRTNELVQWLQNGNAQQQAVAIEELTPVIVRQARRLRATTGAWLMDELMEEAPGIIWELLRDGKYATDRNFAGWCSTVLRNELRQRLRAGKTREKHEEAAGSQLAPTMSVERAIAAPSQFSPEDVRILQGWPVKRRVLIVTLAGLWTKVEPATWREWVDDVGFVHPFPPAGFVNAIERTQRLTELAEAAGCTANTISRIKYEHFKDLSQLPYIQEINCDQ